MDRAVAARGNGRRNTGLPSSARLTQLLASVSRLVESGPPDTISAASVSAPVDSPEQADELADFIQQFAAEHGVLAFVECGDRRLRVRFRPLADSSPVDGA